MSARSTARVRPIWICLLTLAAVTLVAQVADGSRRARHAERKAMIREAGRPPYPRSWYRLRTRVSTVNRHWGAVYVTGRKGHRRYVQPDVTSLRRRHGHWRVHQQGNGGGCDVPRGVRRDLGLACY